jgi:hypothetical protein
MSEPHNNSARIRSLFEEKPAAVAAESMCQVDVLLNEHFRKHGYAIGTYGVKYAVASFDGEQIDVENFAFTAYSYAECLKWLLDKIDHA